ncbi:hypothetical protein F8M41_010091 [Gigaspora margarita]|uniref:MD-2-related lipid-recognition domain-containing protein n=1 Tax=Gigaspora margarita TaxID=4874 RepID=A0A8H4AUI9_GIGMA|nr:hypothetical protein F8M41_010091 [Gigaspora margarita]
MKNFSFEFILFALLLIVNAAPFQLNKRATTFMACPSSAVIDLLTVKIGTDPPESGKPESFNVSGKLTRRDITKNQTLFAIQYNDAAENVIADNYTQTFNDSIKAGTQFTVSASDVPTPNLPDEYFITVAVGDPDSDNIIFAFACAFAKVGGSSEKSKIIINN